MGASDVGRAGAGRLVWAPVGLVGQADGVQPPRAAVGVRGGAAVDVGP
jgi:hypothetical protein